MCMIGCGWKVTPLSRPEIPLTPKLIAERVILQINDVGLIWGGDLLGEIVRDILIEEDTFQDVYYPIEPLNPPSLKLIITATGKVDEEVVIGTVKAIIIGMLFFIPVGIIRFNKDFDLDAEIVLLKGSKKLQEFQVNTSTTISHTMFSNTTAYEEEARRIAFKNLGQQIVASLRPTT